MIPLLIINGPNLQNIGIREPDYYGNTDFDQYLANLQKEFSNLNLSYYQSNYEDDIVNKIHTESSKNIGIILNAGAFTHTSVAIRDAIASIKKPVVLVHISNVYARDRFRLNNIIAPVCKGIITGFGLESYKLAIQSLIN